MKLRGWYVHGLQAKMLGFTLGIFGMLLLVVVLGFVGMRQIEQAARRVTRDCLPLLESFYRAGLALQEGRRIRDQVMLDVVRPEAFDDVRRYEGTFQQTMIRFDMYMKAIIWGSESEVFRRSGGGLTYAEWARHGLRGKLIVPPAPRMVQQLASVADLEYAGFSNHALSAIKSHRRALRSAFSDQRIERDLQQAQVQAARERSEQYIAHVERVIGQVSADVGSFVTDNVASIGSAQRVTMILVTTTSGVFLVAIVIFCLAFAQRVIMQPIHALTEGAKAIGEGAFHTRITLRTRDELDQLAGAFNEMTANLRSTMVSKGYVEQIIESMVNPLIATDPHAIIETANPAACSLLGYSREELVGQSLQTVLVTNATPFSAEVVIQRGSLSGMECFLKPRHTPLIPVLFSAAAIQGGAGDVRGFVCFAQNITERKLAEATLLAANKRLEALNRLKDEFVANASHELRTPLTAVKEGLSLLLDRALGDITAEQEDFIRTMDGDVDRLTELINNMLDIARIEAGRFRLHRQRLAVGPLITSVLKSYQPIAGRRALKVESPPVPDVFADPGAIRQVLDNLFANAVKFTREDGAITVSVQEQEHGVGISVIDDGVGIAKDDVPKLFQKFSQLYQGKDKPRGTGLGLALCRQLIELHRGTIAAIPGPAGGSVFTLTLPIFAPDRALGESFEDILADARYTGERSIGLIAIESVRPGSSDAAVATVRTNVQREDIVLLMEPRWIVILAVADASGLRGMPRRLRRVLEAWAATQAGSRASFRFGVALFPSDGSDVQRLFARAKMEAGSAEGAQGPETTSLPGGEA